MTKSRQIIGFLATALVLCSLGFAQEAAKPAPPRRMAFQTTPNDTVVSPEVHPDKTVTFRLYAPEAKSVKVTGEWGVSPEEAHKAYQGIDLQAAPDGVWSVTVGPLPPGTFRYNFLVDGAIVSDPRNPNVSQSLSLVRGMVSIPGLDYQDLQDVPHGAVATVWYQSKALGTLRRMHIYTPPGYETGKIKYPVFYLLHGAMDTDDCWPTVGRANTIMDNLIAAGQAKPMIVAMPAGHTQSTFQFGDRSALTRHNFEKDFEQDIVPYVESHYRVLSGRNNRAIAGLSMGGSQTLNVALTHPDEFAYIGVFSSGWILQNPEDIEKEFATGLNDDRGKKGIKVFWFATGKDDGLLSTTQSTVELLKKHGFNVEFQETAGLHNFINWRDYLHQFAPRLFK